MSSSPENTEPTPVTPELGQAKERLQSLGELLVNASTLIELLHTKHEADYIDYILTFPVLPYSTAVLPSVFTAENPDYIVVTAGMNKADDGHAAISSAAIDIVTPHRALKLVRDTTTIEGDDSEDDLLIEIQPPNSPESDSEETAQPLRPIQQEPFLQEIPRVPRREVNALLMSLALPDQGEYLSFKDKNLFDVGTFSYLIEALRSHALEANTSGFYTFRDGNAELNFTKTNDNVSFYINYIDPRTGRVLMANIDTQTGFILDFSAFDKGNRTKYSPSNEDIEKFLSVLDTEIAAIGGTHEVPYDRTNSANPEDLAVDRITHEEMEWRSLADRFEEPESD